MNTVRTYRAKKILIIGGTAAGSSAAAQARKTDPRAQITLIQKAPVISFAACGLPYFISGEVAAPEKLLIRSIADFEAQGIKVLTAHEALNFNSIKRKVYIRRLSDGHLFELTYDRLIIATGANTVSLPLANPLFKNVFYVRNLSDGMGIKSLLESGKVKDAAIIGGGYIGLEMAEALHKWGIKTSIIEKALKILPRSSDEINDILMTALLQKNITIYLNNELRQINGASDEAELILASGPILRVQLIIVAIGVKPNVDFAQSGGVALGKTGAISVSPKMATNIHNVYAAGDCAEAHHRITNRNHYVPLGTTANKQGRVAGINAAGGHAIFKGILGSMAVKVFDIHVARCGLCSDGALKYGFKAESVFIAAHSRASYFPSGSPVWIKLVFEKRNGRLLGAEMAGEEGIAKRVDIFATALQQKMTVFDICALDLTYAPPFAPVWDPVLIAAREAAKKVKA